MNTIAIYFDGGCSPNPGNKYGSYEVRMNGSQIISEQRFQLGWGTNNEAEFESLRMALEAVSQRLESEQAALEGYRITVETDSKIVLNRLMNKNKIHNKAAWKSASERMFNLAESCLIYLRKFAAFTVEWRSREHNVARFGH